MKNEKKKKKWHGTWPASCDICGLALQTCRWFVHGKTARRPWALMCPECFGEYGRGLGLGLGQMYNSSSLEKVR